MWHLYLASSSRKVDLWYEVVDQRFFAAPAALESRLAMRSLPLHGKVVLFPPALLELPGNQRDIVSQVYFKGTNEFLVEFVSALLNCSSLRPLSEVGFLELMHCEERLADYFLSALDQR